MRRALTLLALVAVALAADARPLGHRGGRLERTNSRTPQGRSDRGLPGTSFAFFEAFPATGEGTGAACACAAVTGAKGEALTFTRASAATCTATAAGGLATTGIANGDLVSCTTNAPRVEYDSAGVKGVLVESTRTNSLLRSEELDNAAWTLDGALTFGTQGVSPAGTTTAELLVDNAATFEGLYQPVTAVAGTYTCSVFVKGDTSTTPLFQLQDVGGTGVLQSATPTLSTTTWTRQVLTITTAGGGTTGYRFFIYPHATAGSSGNIYAWGAQCEAGAYATSYIATTSAAVARSVDLGYFSPSWPSTIGSGCVAATSSGYHGQASATWVALQNGNDYLMAYVTGASATIAQGTEGAAVQRTATGVGVPTSASYRMVARQIGTTIDLLNNGTTVSTTAGSASTWTPNRLSVGNWSVTSGFALDGIVSRVQADPSPARCSAQ